MIDFSIAGRTAVVTGLGSLAATLVAIFVSYPAHDVDVEIVTKTVLVTLVLFLLLPNAIRRPWARHRGSGLLSVLVGTVLGYVVDVASWAGRAYAGQLVHSPGAVTILLDLALWLVVVAIAVQVRLTQRHEVHAPPTYVA